MSVKRYNPELEKDGGLGVPCLTMRSNSIGSWVDYHEYAALEARCAALVAENAGLKSAFDKPDAWLSWHSIPPTFYEPDRGGEYLQVHEKAGEKNDDGSDSWPVYRKPETETPATDAFLAEVRARGVEMLRKHPAIKLCSLTHVCDEFAAQLRKGGA